VSERVPIRPDTKIGRLLDDWPDLEPVLMEQSPTFAKLTNPILRRTVARIATIAAAAKMGDLRVVDLVATLRGAAGLPPLALTEEVDADESGVEGTVVDTIDADARLEAGENPLAAVRRRMADLAAGELLRVRSSFRPEPLLDALRRVGAPVAVREREDGGFETLVGGPPALGDPDRGA